MFVKTFKGYEDRTADLDTEINEWIQGHGSQIEVMNVRTALSHESQSRARSGDLIYTILYRAEAPLP